MKTTLLSFFLLFVIFVTTSCQKDDTTEEESGSQGEYVLGKSTVELNTSQSDRIQEMRNGNTLVFSDGTRETDIPKVGQIILVKSGSQNCPNGFMGKITSITQVDGKLEVKTEIPLLAETFEEFHSKDSIHPYENDSPGRVQTDPEDFDWDEQGIKLQIGINQVEGIFKLGTKALLNIDVSNGKAWLIGTLRTKVIVELSPSLVLENNNDPLKFKIFEKKIGYIPTSVPGIGNIDVLGALDVVFEPKASLILAGKVCYEKEFVTAVTFNNGAWAYAPPKEVPTKNWSFTPAAVSLKGDVFAGLEFDIKFVPIDEAFKEIFLIQIANKFGIQLNGEVNLVGKDPIKIYEENKDASIQFSAVINNAFEAESAFLSKKDKLSIPMIELVNIPLGERYLFPVFSDIKVEKKKENKSVTLKAKVSRDLLLESKLGWALYNTGENYVNTPPVLYLREEQFENPLSGTFSQLNNTTRYQAVPYISFGGLGFVATESAREISLDHSTIVGTWKGIIGFSCHGGVHTTQQDEVVFKADGTGYILYSGSEAKDGMENFTYTIDYQTHQLRFLFYEEEENQESTINFQLEEDTFTFSDRCPCGKIETMILYRN